MADAAASHTVKSPPDSTRVKPTRPSSAQPRPSARIRATVPANASTSLPTGPRVVTAKRYSTVSGDAPAPPAGGTATAATRPRARKRRRSMALELPR